MRELWCATKNNKTTCYQGIWTAFYTFVYYFYTNGFLKENKPLCVKKIRLELKNVEKAQCKNSSGKEENTIVNKKIEIRVLFCVPGSQ